MDPFSECYTAHYFPLHTRTWRMFVLLQQAAREPYDYIQDSKKAGGF